jgi:NitT/TauT family transport system permease protein
MSVDQVDGVDGRASAADSPPSGDRAGRSKVAIRALAVVALFAAWYALTATLGDDVVPSPGTVGSRLWHVWTRERFAYNVWHTTVRVVLGMLGSLILALAVGVAMGLSRRLEQFFDLFILLGRTIPGVAWALLAVMIVGINDGAPVLAIVLAATPMVTVQIWQGTKSLDRDLLQMARVFRVRRLYALRHVVLPAIVPSIVGGAKLGLALSWQVVVLSELFGLSNGVGYEINQNFSDFSIAGVVAWTLSFTAIMAVLEFGILAPLENRVTRWRPRRQVG